MSKCMHTPLLINIVLKRDVIAILWAPPIAQCCNTEASVITNIMTSARLKDYLQKHLAAI